jgi:hypothetical protein
MKHALFGVVLQIINQSLKKYAVVLKMCNSFSIKKKSPSWHGAQLKYTDNFTFCRAKVLIQTLWILNEDQCNLFQAIHHDTARMYPSVLQKPWRAKLGIGMMIYKALP